METIDVVTNLLKDKIIDNNEINKTITNESSTCIKCMLIKQKCFYICIVSVTLIALTFINFISNMVMNQDINGKIFNLMNSKYNYNNSSVP